MVWWYGVRHEVQGAPELGPGSANAAKGGVCGSAASWINSELYKAKNWGLWLFFPLPQVMLLLKTK